MQDLFSDMYREDLFREGEKHETSGDYERARECYLTAAEAGNTDAQFRLGTLYYRGCGVKRSPREAIKWYRRSAEGGNAGTQRRMGSFYQYGTPEFGIQQDDTEAVRWYELAANGGDAVAQYRLGALCAQGRGVEKDPHRALFWLEKSLAQGEYVASRYLGMMYERGEGVAEDEERAAELYLDAAKEGDCVAQFLLGNIWERHPELEGYAENALALWRDSDENEYPEAAYRLGYAYYDGDLVPRDLEMAKHYFERALAGGCPCEYALQMTRAELGEEDTRNAMREYAEALTKRQLSGGKLYAQISRDLQKDFGTAWEKTSRESKKFLETGMLSYVTLYSLGPSVYGNLDFSAAITPLFKALERELGRYLYTGYLSYLQKAGVSPDVFPSGRSFLKRVGAVSFAYKSPSELSEFTLGCLLLTLGVERLAEPDEQTHATHTLDRAMLAYLDTLFSEDAFGTQRAREIYGYILSLAQEVKTIADSLRNPAAHNAPMKCAKAEACGNYLIKTRRLLAGFLEKIRPDALIDNP